MSRYVLALDQGTTSSRAVLFDRGGRPVACRQQEFTQILPAPGLVEHDPDELWNVQLEVARQVLRDASVTPDDVAALGIANQRETVVLWERAGGRPVGNAVVWQSRISADLCRRLREEGVEDRVRQKTGLLLDPYFTGTKLMLLLTRDPALRRRAERGEVLFGTVDSFLLWRLTGGRLHATDPSNASRTLLYNLHTRDWDDELLALFCVPRAMLPQVLPSSGVCGTTDDACFGGPIPIAGVAGDQQAALFGQLCFQPGDAKCTYGTGAFLLMNTAEQPIASRHGLLTTVGWQRAGKTTYCLEGSVFIAGAVVQWLRDGLGILGRSADVEPLARSVPDSGGVYFVPAFAGLGAPHWDAYARGTLVGLTRGTTAGHLARAALESIAFQVADLMEVIAAEGPTAPAALRVDGGAAVNDLLLQIQADLLGIPVHRPQVAETTALGAAYLAGLAVGYWNDLEELKNGWRLDREFVPAMSAAERAERRRTWRRAVQRARGWVEAT